MNSNHLEKSYLEGVECGNKYRIYLEKYGADDAKTNWWQIPRYEQDEKNNKLWERGFEIGKINPKYLYEK